MPFEEILAVDRIQAVIDELGDVRQLDRRLIWVRGRVPVVHAEDGEILAYYQNRLVIAPIIGLDARAPLRSFHPIHLDQTEIPKIKHGMLIPESQLALLMRIEANMATSRDMGIFGNYLAGLLMDLQSGVYARQEWEVMQMLLDSLTYDANGIKLSVNWAMPSDLKVTPGTPWSTAATATPITDLLSVQRVAREKYGINLNRATMSTQALIYLSLTTEFKNVALPLLSALSLADAQLVGGNDTMLTRQLVERRTGIQIEVDDRQFWVEAADGSQSATRYLPTQKVLLTSTELDGDGNTFDFANGTVIESYAGLGKDMIGQSPGEQDGPFTYFEDAGSDPPGIKGYSVARGFPRKHQKAASAVLTVYTP